MILAPLHKCDPYHFKTRQKWTRNAEKWHQGLCVVSIFVYVLKFEMMAVSFPRTLMSLRDYALTVLTQGRAESFWI